ncbi:hypothetical protein Hanom_Chr08g00715871 [Helianthus anomalus]
MTVLPYGLIFGVCYGLRSAYYMNDNVMVMIWSCFVLVLFCFGLVLAANQTYQTD